MAIEYSIVVDTTKSPRQLLMQLADRLAFQKCEGALPEVFAEGIVCTALGRSKIGQELIQEAFGIGSSVSIDCRIDKFDLLTTGMNHLVDLCVCLIQSEPSDFVLLANHESGLLLRKNGRLEANCRDQYWNDKWNAKLVPAGVNFVTSSLPAI